MPLRFFARARAVASLRSFVPVVLALGALGPVGCAAPEEVPASAEDDVTSRVALDPIAVAPELATAAKDAADASGLIVDVAAFRYDAKRTKDPARVISAVRSKLAHPRLRVDEGEITGAVLDATFDEYGITEAPTKAALASAVGAFVGAAPRTKKLWLRSDDVAGADSEWAEVVFVWVSPERGTALRLTLRYEA